MITSNSNDYHTKFIRMNSVLNKITLPNERYNIRKEIQNFNVPIYSIDREYLLGIDKEHLLYEIINNIEFK